MKKDSDTASIIKGLLVATIDTDDEQKKAENYKLALNLSRKIRDTSLIIRSLFKLGDTHNNIGAFNIAASYYSECLELTESKGSGTMAYELKTQLGIIFTSLGQTEKAEAYLLDVLKYSIQTNDDFRLAGVYNNLGILYRKTGNIEKATEYYTKAIDVCQRSQNRSTLMQTYNNLGYLYMQKGELNNCLEYFSRSLDIARSLDDKYQQGLVLENIGSVQYENGDLSSALRSYTEGLICATESNDLIGIANMHLGLSNVYGALQKNNEAYFHLKAYNRLNDSLIALDNERQIQKELLKHEFEKEKMEILRQQEKSNLIAQSEKKKRELIILFISAGLLMVASLLFILYRRFRLTSEQKLIIEQQKKIVDIKQKEILDSIHYAKRIQTALLAHKEFVDQHLPGNFIYFNPKDIVSGDFYWATKHGNKFYLAVCDSTGHGVPGAFMSLINIGFINEAISEKDIPEPHEIFNYVRKRLETSISKDNQQDGFDGILLCLDLSSGKITYAAANNAPVIAGSHGIKNLETDKMPVGPGIKDDPFQLFELKLEPDEILYLYTDGYADQFGGPKGKKFKYKQLNDLLLQIKDKEMSEQLTVLKQSFENWKGGLEQVDDVCVIGIKL